MNVNVNMNMNMNRTEGRQFHQHEMGSPSQSESEMVRFIEEGLDSNSGSDNQLEVGSGDDQNQRSGGKRKQYHRHTPYQIQVMENFYKECPHPDDKQRKDLGRILGLAPLQVKFWFQNKRTQKKTQLERYENMTLRREKEMLRAENVKLNQVIDNASCPTCHGPAVITQTTPEQQTLMIENARLRDEADNNKGLRAGICGAGDIFRTVTAPTDVADKMIIANLAVAAMEEFLRMARLEEPLWFPGLDGQTAVLNEGEYMTVFPRSVDQRYQDFKREASRATAVIMMEHINVIEMLMDVGLWSAVFCPLISRAKTVEVLATGINVTHDGALHMVAAELQFPAPSVPTRETTFLRYSKKHAEGIWAVVDVSVEILCPTPQLKVRRRPSGCLIQEIPNGYSKITWIEHVEVDDRLVPDLYRPVINSALAFGAQRWVGTLNRYCEHLASSMASLPPDAIATMGLTSEGARQNMMQLAERMVMGYCQGVSATSTQTWTVLCHTGINEVRIMSKRNFSNPGRPTGIALCASTSFWLPASPKTVFDFLRKVTNRDKWDVLSNCGKAERLVHIGYGGEGDNYISLYRVESLDSNRDSMLMIQETRTDALGSYVIYAPTEFAIMNGVLAGGPQENVPILPSGFAILPDGPVGWGNDASLLTIAFQVSVEASPNAQLSQGSVATINGLIINAVARLKSWFLGSNNAQMYPSDGQSTLNIAGVDGAANNDHLVFINAGEDGAVNNGHSAYNAGENGDVNNGHLVLDNAGEVGAANNGHSVYNAGENGDVNNGHLVLDNAGEVGAANNGHSVYNAGENGALNNGHLVFDNSAVEDAANNGHSVYNAGENGAVDNGHLVFDNAGEDGALM